MKKRYLLIGLLVVLLAIIGGVAAFTYYFMSSETSIRDSWEVETGDLLVSNERIRCLHMRQIWMRASM